MMFHILLFLKWSLTVVGKYCFHVSPGRRICLDGYGEYLVFKDMFGGTWSHQMLTIWFGRICLVGHIRWWVFGLEGYVWRDLVTSHGEYLVAVKWDGRCAQSCGRELMAELTAVWKAGVVGVKIAEEISKHIQTNLYSKTKKYLVLNRVDRNWWPN